MRIKHLLVSLILAALLAACQSSEPPNQEASKQKSKPQQSDKPVAADVALEPVSQTNPHPQVADDIDIEARLAQYASVPLTADLSHLSENQQQMILKLIQAAKVMDILFWQQSFKRERVFAKQFTGSEAALEYARINYGPWDRLDNEKPFLKGYDDKPLGAQFYPADMTVEEFEAADLADKKDLYTYVRRGDDGQLTTVPYHKSHPKQLARAAEYLKEAADLAEDQGFADYLRLRAKALVTDDYQPSDMAWMDVKTNAVDVVIGAIETYEDRLFGYKAGYEAYVLLKDMAWSDRLSRYAAFLPELQAGLPVDAAYKAEMPGTDSDLNAYDVLYYAGHSNAGSKTIAINLPNDEEVQLSKGTRRLQLKNAMRAKFDQILVPLADVLIDESQRQYITFNAFFSNTMFHEVAHGLGIKNTVNDQGTVRQALKDLASATEEGKADILGLYMIEKLFEKGEIPEGQLMDHYVTFMAGIFRSVRFGASSAHGRANMLRFNYFAEQGAFSRDPATGQYRVDQNKFKAAVQSLSQKILTLQGDGDYAGTKAMMDRLGRVSPELQADLIRLSDAGIPVDITFRQGSKLLGLAYD